MIDDPEAVAAIVERTVHVMCGILVTKLAMEMLDEHMGYKPTSSPEMAFGSGIYAGQGAGWNDRSRQLMKYLQDVDTRAGIEQVARDSVQLEVIQ